MDSEGILSSGEGLTNASAAASTFHGPDKRYTAVSADETKRLAEYIPGPLRFSLRGRTRGKERKLSTDARGLVSFEGELEIALAVEEEAVLEETYMTDAGVSIEMPTEKNQDLPPSPTTQAELIRPPFRKGLNMLRTVPYIMGQQQGIQTNTAPQSERRRV